MVEYRYRRFWKRTGMGDHGELVDEWLNERAAEGFEIYQITDGFVQEGGFAFITMVKYG